MAVVIGLMTGTMEEFGWTGFALPRLLARNSALVAALTLGVIWSAWHILPSIWGLSPSYPALGFFGLVVGVTGFATIPAYRILMSWVYVNTKGSLLVTITMHAFYDASLVMFVPSSLTQARAVEFYGAFAIALWIAVAVVIARFGASRLTGRTTIVSASSSAKETRSRQRSEQPTTVATRAAIPWKKSDNEVMIGRGKCVAET